MRKSLVRTILFYFPGKSYGPGGAENFENHMDQGGPKISKKMPSSRYQYKDLISPETLHIPHAVGNHYLKYSWEYFMQKYA